MSIHSSLRSAGAGRKHRSVLKRYERLKVLKDKNAWDESRSVLGLPKVKMQKVKVRKEAKAADATVGAPGAAAPAAGTGAATPAGGASAAGGKGAAPAGKAEKK